MKDRIFFSFQKDEETRFVSLNTCRRNSESGIFCEHSLSSNKGNSLGHTLASWVSRVTVSSSASHHHVPVDRISRPALMWPANAD